MNIKDHVFFYLPAIALYPTQQNCNCLHICNRQYTEFHISDVWSRRSLGRKPEFSFSPLGFDISHLKCLESSVPWGKPEFSFSPLGFDIQTNSDHKTQKIKLYSVRDLKRYRIEKNLIQGRVVATISKNLAQRF